MKKLALIFMFFLLPFFVFGEGLFSSTEEINKGGITQSFNFNSLKSDFQKDQESSKKSYAESVWNFDLEAFQYHLPSQPADWQFRQDGYSLGLTYRFSNLLYAFAEYVSFSIKGKSDYTYRGAEWDHTHYIGGFGAVFKPVQAFDVLVQGGYPFYSEVTEKESGDSVKVDDAFEVKVKLLKKFDNIGVGVVWGKMFSSWVETRGYVYPAGYEYFALVLQVGIPTLN